MAALLVEILDSPDVSVYIIFLVIRDVGCPATSYYLSLLCIFLKVPFFFSFNFYSLIMRICVWLCAMSVVIVEVMRGCQISWDWSDGWN